MNDFLSEEQRADLIQRHKKEKDKRVCDRIKAVLLTNQGYDAAEIASILLLDDETVRRYVRDYFKKAKLSPEHKGSQSKLDNDQTQKLIGHLLEHTYLHAKSICH